MDLFNFSREEEQVIEMTQDLFTDETAQVDFRPNYHSTQLERDSAGQENR
jgi:hypothetical protein